jgi:hypothetical protein
LNDTERAKEAIRRAASDAAGSRDHLLAALRDPSRLVRLTAAIELGTRGIAPLPEQSVRDVADALLHGRDADLDEAYAEATATEDDVRDLEQELALALAALPAGWADFAILPLIELWRRDRQFYEAALAAIALAFGPSDVPRADGLSAPQRHVLVALSEDESIWNCCGDAGPLLAERGLPQSQRALRAFLSAHAART